MNFIVFATFAFFLHKILRETRLDELLVILKTFLAMNNTKQR